MIKEVSNISKGINWSEFPISDTEGYNHHQNTHEITQIDCLHDVLIEANALARAHLPLCEKIVKLKLPEARKPEVVGDLVA